MLRSRVLTEIVRGDGRSIPLFAAHKFRTRRTALEIISSPLDSCQVGGHTGADWTHFT
jgi:hypothetical protein